MIVTLGTTSENGWGGSGIQDTVTVNSWPDLQAARQGVQNAWHNELEHIKLDLSDPAHPRFVAEEPYSAEQLAFPKPSAAWTEAMSDHIKYFVPLHYVADQEVEIEIAVLIDQAQIFGIELL